VQGRKEHKGHLSKEDDAPRLSKEAKRQEKKRKRKAEEAAAAAVRVKTPPSHWDARCTRDARCTSLASSRRLVVARAQGWCMQQDGEVSMGARRSLHRALDLLSQSRPKARSGRLTKHDPTAQGDVRYSARLQELGPRFTLRMQSLQRGTFDSQGGEYEWVRENGKSVTRKKFCL
jgi:hypothetical protein